MMIRSRTAVTTTILALLMLTPALSAEPDLVRDRDRVTGTLPEGGSEAGLALDALEGTVLSLKVKAAGGSSLEPEIRLYDPDGVRVAAGSRYRHSAGSRKARIKRLELAMTGRYTVVIKSLASSSGDYRLEIRAKHPRKIQDRGDLVYPGLRTHLRFPAFAGTTARVQVKGRDGLLPRVEEMLRPDVRSVALPEGQSSGAKTRIQTGECALHGDYRVVIEGRDGTSGAWKGKVRLRHPEADRREIVVDGQPADTFTAGMTETPPGPILPPPGPPPPSGPLTFRVLDQGAYSAIQTARQFVARTASAYSVMWSQHRPPMPPGVGAPESPPPSVDFTREIVVGIFLGGRNTGGYVATVLSVARQGTGAIVTWQEQQPGWSPVPQVITYPYVIIAMTRVDGTVTLAGTVVVQ